MLTSTWELHVGEALAALEMVLRHHFLSLTSLSPTPFPNIGISGKAYHAGQPVVMAGQIMTV